MQPLTTKDTFNPMDDLSLRKGRWNRNLNRWHCLTENLWVYTYAQNEEICVKSPWNERGIPSLMVNSKYRLDRIWITQETCLRVCLRRTLLIGLTEVERANGKWLLSSPELWPWVHRRKPVQHCCFLTKDPRWVDAMWPASSSPCHHDLCHDESHHEPRQVLSPFLLLGSFVMAKENELMYPPTPCSLFFHRCKWW